ncbi:MAG: DUF72 domain-containing protein, partial [Candidatus Lokiarchaeota archaeon]|nr:DUF72 domain-containing protein [Candidatus Lokiarchaeota archaeon]
DKTPKNFRFSIKVWRDISHQRDMNERASIDDKISYFITELTPIIDKIECLLLQFPSSFEPNEKNIEYLEKVISIIDNLSNFDVIVELRNNNWFSSDTQISNLIQGEVYLGTIYLKNIQPFYNPAQNKYYIRLIGDRKLSDFSRIQREMKETWKELISKLYDFQKNEEITDIFVIFNNHFSGFAPQDCLRLKKELGLKYKRFDTQRKLNDYI